MFLKFNSHSSQGNLYSFEFKGADFLSMPVNSGRVGGVQSLDASGLVTWA